MRKMLPYLGASLSLLALTWATAVKAQDAKPFEDVKPDHWAYGAVTDLHNKGIIIGYPDGHFNGQRTLTRYEFAVALKRALDKIGGGVKGDTGAQGERGPAGEAGPAGPQGPIGPPGMTPAEVDELRRLTQTFKDELAALGVNMADVKRRLDDLDKRVGAIERRLDKMIQFNGDFFIGARSTRSRYGFLDYSGGPVGPQQSMFDNFVTPHDFHLEAHANLPNGIKVHADLVNTNYLSYRAGNLNGGGLTTLNQAGNFGIGGGLNSDTFLYEANIVVPVGDTLTRRRPNESVAPATQLTIGRYREQVTPLTYYRPDYDAYFDLPWYDDGSYVQDGFELKTKFGSAVSKIFGASYGSVTANFGNPINSPVAGSVLGMAHPNPLFLAGLAAGAGGVPAFLAGGIPGGVPAGGLAGIGGMVAGQVVGGHVGIPLFKLGELGLTLIDFGSTGGGAGVAGFGAGGGFGVAGTTVGNVVVYGADVKLNAFGRLNVNGEISKSVTQRSFDTGDRRPNDDDNAYQLNVGYNTGALKATAGYQYIDPRFAAPGYWNKLGSWYNPTNVQGPYARVAYNFTDKLQGHIGGDWLSGARNRPGVGGMTVGSSVMRGTAGVKFNLTKTVDLSADYEGVFYDLSSAVSANPGRRGKPVEQFITFGAGVNLTSNSVLKFGYQIVSLQDVGGGFGIAAAGIPGGNLNGSVFTSQVAVHF